MEFKSLKNIESSFRQIRLFGIVFLSLCAVITVWSVWSSYRFAERQREKIYVLDNGKSLMLALSQDLSQNRPAEAREHVRRFHELFFTLRETRPAISGQKRVQLLFGLCREGVLQPHHRREHQSGVEGGQRGVRFQRLSLPCRDLRHAEDHPAEQPNRPDSL